MQSTFTRALLLSSKFVLHFYLLCMHVYVHICLYTHAYQTAYVEAK